MEKSDRYRAPALDKGLDILELLAASSEGLTQVEIAKGLQRGPNEIYRMIDTLVRRGYVIRSTEGDRYLLSLRMLVLSNMHAPRRRLLDATEPLLRRFSREMEQSVHLVVMEEEDVIVISSFAASGNWQMSLRSGSVIGLFNTGSGLVLASFQDPETRSRLVKQHELVPGEEVVKPKVFEALAERVRAEGYHVGDSQTAVGVVNISFPILDPFGHAIAAVTCPYLLRIDTHATQTQAQAVDALGEIARTISLQVFGPTSQQDVDQDQG